MHTFTWKWKLVYCVKWKHLVCKWKKIVSIYKHLFKRCVRAWACMCGYCLVCWPLLYAYKTFLYEQQFMYTHTDWILRYLKNAFTPDVSKREEIRMFDFICSWHKTKLNIRTSATFMSLLDPLWFIRLELHGFPYSLAQHTWQLKCLKMANRGVYAVLVGSLFINALFTLDQSNYLLNSGILWHLL